jgi:hypothetical protein
VLKKDFPRAKENELAEVGIELGLHLNKIASI